MAKKSDSKLTAVRRMIKRQGGRRVPAVGAVDPEVRTDWSIPTTGGSGDKGLKEEIKVGHALGAYVVEWGYDIPEPKWPDFHKWLLANEAALAAHAPEGVAYKGTVVAVFGPLNRPDGRYRTFWALDSTCRVEQFWTKGDGDFKRLLKQFVAFPERGECCENGFSQLYQVAAGAPIY